MTISEILSNEELRRDEFPVAHDKVYLAHAGVCPLPRRVAEAVAHTALNSTQDDQEAAVPPTLLRETRALGAQLLGCDAAEVALVGPTTLGLSYVANGFPWRRGDNMLIYFDDYPSNVYPWMALAERGVEVRLLNLKQLGRIRAADVLGQVDEQTRVVALASCHFLSGWRLDLDGIGRGLRARGIRFCVDGIQTLGAFPTSVANVDFLAADAHKWLLGPLGAGLLYVRKELQDTLRPSVRGWHNVRCPGYVAQEEMVFRTDARRYEAGSANLLGIAGLRAALQLALEVGVKNIAVELLRKRTWLVPALKAKGWEILQGDAPSEHASAILSLHRTDTDLTALHAKLAATGIVTSLRTDRSARQYIRLSPHWYNTDAELHRAVEML
jgi:cysteine desulfurase / selenocysteine lyase